MAIDCGADPHERTATRTGQRNSSAVIASGLEPSHRLALALAPDVKFGLWTWATRNSHLGTIAGIAPVPFIALPCS